MARRVRSIGLQYTRLYREKEKEVELTKLLLEISNDINARTDFKEIIPLSSTGLSSYSKQITGASRFSTRMLIR